MNIYNNDRFLSKALDRVRELEASVKGVNEQYDAALGTVIQQQARITELEAENRGKDATIQKLLDGAVPRNSVGNVKDALRQAVKTTEGVRRKLADSESGPNCKYCGRDLVYCNCGAGGPCDQLIAENALLRKALQEIFNRSRNGRSGFDSEKQILEIAGFARAALFPSEAPFRIPEARP